MDVIENKDKKTTKSGKVEELLNRKRNFYKSDSKETEIKKYLNNLTDIISKNIKNRKKINDIDDMKWNIGKLREYEIKLLGDCIILEDLVAINGTVYEGLKQEFGDLNNFLEINKKLEEKKFLNTCNKKLEEENKKLKDEVKVLKKRIKEEKNIKILS